MKITYEPISIQLVVLWINIMKQMSKIFLVFYVHG